MELHDLEDLWESKSQNHEILEASENEVDGVHILAKVRGPAFFPNSTSGNRVYYSKDAWVNAISEDRFRKRLEDRLIYGTIGHGQVINDNAIMEGKFSHIVTDVSINEDTGEGEAEYLILNTPTGRVLNTVLRAKSKLRVSTKAKGLLESKSYQGSQKAVNPDKFYLERIDFVLDPGYDQALPDLIESLTSNDDESLIGTTTQKGEIMDPATQKLLDVMESSINDLKGDNKVKDETIQEMREQVGQLSEQFKTVEESNSQLKSELEDKVAGIEESQGELAKYKELGTPEEISEALEKSSATIDDLNSRLEQNANDIAESLIADEDKEILESYRQFGTIEELQELLESADKLADQFIEQRLENIRTKYDVSESLVTHFHEKGLSVDDIEESIRLISEQEPAKPARKTMSSRDFQQPASSEINESQTHQEVKSLSKKLFGSIK